MCNALDALPCALFDALTRLEWLNLAFNRSHGLPASIAKLTVLTGLDLAYNGIENEGAHALKGLANLTSLNLCRNRIGDEGAQALEGLVNLTSLNLEGNGIGSEGAQALKGLTALMLASTCPPTKSGPRGRRH